MNYKTIGLVFAAGILFAIACTKKIGNGPDTFTSTETAQLLNAYFTALSTGDSTVVKRYWSRRSIVRRGFWTIHNVYSPWGSFSEWKTYVQGGTYVVQNVDRQNDHYFLQVHWMPRDSTLSQPRNLRFYVVQENGRWVFINPLDLFTSDWKTYSTEQIMFHYPPQIDISDYLDEIQYTT